MTAALITTIILFIGSVIMYQIKVMDMKKQMNDLKKHNPQVIDRCKKFLDTHRKLSPGQRAMYEYRLRHSGKHFTVQYEVDILSIAENKVKIRAIDLYTEYEWAKKNKQQVINYIDGKWIESSNLDPVMDNKAIRQDKLNKLLYEDE